MGTADCNSSGDSRGVAAMWLIFSGIKGIITQMGPSEAQGRPRCESGRLEAQQVGSRKQCAWRAYLPAPAASIAVQAPCPQLHAIDGRLADPSQYDPQYLLPLAAGQLQPG